MTTRADLSIVILLYNEKDFIEPLCRSLAEQTVQPAQLVFVDNSPDDAIQKLLQRHAPQAQVIHTGENLDFSRGVNRGIVYTATPYVLLLNPDMTFSSTMIQELLVVADSSELFGAVAPKLLRLESGNSKTSVIDSMGICANRSHRFWNTGEGEEDRGQYDTQPSFGIAGTAMLLRRTALNDIAAHGGGKPAEFCDEDFVAYKDDVDLSYRLRHRGWKIAIAPKAIGYHQRTAREQVGVSIISSRKQKSLRIRGNSLRNHWFCLIKNEPVVNLVLFSPWIAWYELRKVIFVLFFEPSTFAILPSTICLLPRMLRKRRAILDSSRISTKNLRTWFTSHL